MAKPTPFPSVTGTADRKKRGRPPAKPGEPKEKRSATLLRLPEYYLRTASTIASARGTDRAEVIRAALDAYFAGYPNAVASVRKEMGE
jgi:hypothetical protein